MHPFSMNSKKFTALLAALLTTTVGFAQSASLTADRPAASAGEVVTIAAAVTYAGTPGALGWSVTLPVGWSYVGTSGPDVPAVLPQQGATGTLEWAFMDAPANAARFSFSVKAAGKPVTQQISGKALVRSNGRQTTAEAAPVTVAVAP